MIKFAKSQVSYERLKNKLIGLKDTFEQQTGANRKSDLLNFQFKIIDMKKRTVLWIGFG